MLCYDVRFSCIHVCLYLLDKNTQDPDKISCKFARKYRKLLQIYSFTGKSISSHGQQGRGGLFWKQTQPVVVKDINDSSVSSHLPTAPLALFFASPESMVFASISFSDIADMEMMLMAMETAAKELTQWVKRLIGVTIFYHSTQV